jgi:hypothetical protein
MRQHNLALIVSHNVTTRDDFDLQQPFNLRVPGGTQTLGSPGKIYAVQYLQLFQADQIRGLGGTASPDPGRRVLAQLLHDADALAVQPPSPNGPPSSVLLGSDGSMAAFVPARRAMTWQLTDPSGAGVVRERMWLTFQPGEIRVCASCHGVNDKDQAGNPPPGNPPLALLTLLQYWKGSTNPAPPLTLSSLPAKDGWVLETGRKTNKGGKLNSAAASLILGDDAADRQYRAILHFDTSTLPDNAVVLSVTLKIKKQGQVGTNPFVTHKPLLVDIRKNFFGTLPGLQPADFQAAASKPAVGTFDATPLGGWYSAVLGSAAFPFINLTGTTQLRLRFSLDDNNNHRADYVTFYSGNAAAANRPQLVIQYYVPVP